MKCSLARKHSTRTDLSCVTRTKASASVSWRAVKVSKVMTTTTLQLKMLTRVAEVI